MFLSAAGHISAGYRCCSVGLDGGQALRRFKDLWGEVATDMPPSGRTLDPEHFGPLPRAREPIPRGSAPQQRPLTIPDTQLQKG